MHSYASVCQGQYYQLISHQNPFPCLLLIGFLPACFRSDWLPTLSPPPIQKKPSDLVLGKLSFFNTQVTVSLASERMDRNTHMTRQTQEAKQDSQMEASTVHPTPQKHQIEKLSIQKSTNMRTKNQLKKQASLEKPGNDLESPLINNIDQTLHRVATTASVIYKIWEHRSHHPSSKKIKHCKLKKKSKEEGARRY
eukprot:XP_011508270.1 testis-expressed protein 50 isoform X1 [Homo sapiens]